MAYCRKCGAYIPDGWDKCPSCGTSDKEIPHTGYKTQSGAQTQRSNNEHNYGDDIRKNVEEYLNQKRQESRKWAESERQRRESSRAQQSSTPYSGSSDTANKALSIMSYIPGLFVLPFILRKNTEENRSVRFHGTQGGILFALGTVAQLAGKFVGIGWLIRMARIVYMIIGIINAANGKDEPLPYIGKII